MNEITIRNATIEDLNDVSSLESEIWPQGTRSPKEKFKSRLEVFPEGFFLAYHGDELIGASTSEIINYNILSPPISWEAITDNGYISRTHNSNGNALYVVSIGAKSRSGGGSLLVNAQKELTKKLNLDCLVLGSRIPGYDSYIKDNGEVSIEDYIELLRHDGQKLDPELRFYTRNGLELLKIVTNYMEDDRESRNYGAIMHWKNPHYA